MLNHASTIEQAALGMRVGARMSMGSCTSERNSKQVVIERPLMSNFISQS